VFELAEKGGVSWWSINDHHPNKEAGYAMSESSVVSMVRPEAGPQDVLTEIAREGARQMLATALEAEVEEFVAGFEEQLDKQGRRRVVRNGFLPERSVQTGIGPIAVQVPRVRDREEDAGEADRIRFSSKIVPPYLRRSKSFEEFLPWLYLKGVSSGDFQDTLAALVGEGAGGLSAATISRLKQGWKEDFQAWSRRDLSRKRYVYWWADGVYVNARLDQKQCLLVIMGATEAGKKELIAVEDGYRESEQSWLEVLEGLKSRGLAAGPKLATGDGALGFWTALSKAYPQSRHQRCWFHKTGNVLNRMPKSLQGKAKSQIHEIWMAATREEATKAFDRFIATFEAKYPKATECLAKDREELLAFYDFPAEHWKHVRTTNPIESTFATVKLRTAKTRGCLSRTTALTMVFQLCRVAEKSWRKLNGPKRFAQVIEGVEFVNGEVKKIAA
jgi:transposase-like protein